MTTVVHKQTSHSSKVLHKHFYSILHIFIDGLRKYTYFECVKRAEEYSGTSDYTFKVFIVPSKYLCKLTVKISVAKLSCIFI